MSGVYRSLLTVCMILGLHIHLPVTMFPASDVEGLKGKGPVNSARSLQRYNFTTNLDVLHWSINEIVEPQIKGHNQNKVNYDSVIRSDYAGLNGMKWNKFQTFTNTRNSKGLMDLSESDPVKLVEKDRHLRMKNDFIRERIKQTEEKLANMSNIFTNNKNDLSATFDIEQTHIYDLKKGDQVKQGLESNQRYAKNANYTKRLENTTSVSSNLASIQRDIKNTRAVWPAELLKRCPKEFSQSDQAKWKYKVQNYEIVKIEEGCGSMLNRLVTFNDSTKACVRYRFNSDLMQGEIYSYYLSQVLKMGYTVPTTLHKIENNKQWSKVLTEVSGAKWSDSKPLIFTKWIENLEPVFMPTEMKSLDVGTNTNTDLFMGKSESELCDLVQWSDLIVFDYMSANPDRVVNNMFNLKWNDKMMDKPIHNLEKSSKNGAFVFLDNESGLFHGYRLLDTHHQFHRQLLDSVCIFKPETINTIEQLHKEGSIGNRLVDAFISGEKHQNMLPRISVKILEILQSRLEDVYKHIQTCKFQKNVQ